MHLLILSNDQAFIQRRFWIQFGLMQNTNEVIGKLYEAEKCRKIADQDIRAIEAHLAQVGGLPRVSRGMDISLAYLRLDHFERECIKNQMVAGLCLDEMQGKVVELQTLSAQIKELIKDQSPEIQQEFSALAGKIDRESALASAWVQDKRTSLDREPEGEIDQSVVSSVREFRETLADSRTRMRAELETNVSDLRFEGVTSFFHN